MKITVNPDRSVKKEYEENEINDGSQNENRVTTISFEVPEDYSDFTKRIVFITKDGNYFDEIANDEYVLKNNITKYKKLAAFVWLINTTTHQDFRSEVFPLEFNYNENFSDSVPSEQEMSQIEILFEQLEDLIEEVESIENLTYEIVEELPTENIDPHVIYLVLREDSEPNNIYDEWMYINEEWELIGTTAIDLQPLQKEIDEINEMLFTHTTAQSENSEATLNGNSNLEMNITELDGKIEQDSTQGDNFANCNGMNTTTNNGVTFTINKENGLTKSVKINGTSVNYDSYCVGTAYLLKAGTYTVYGNGVTNDIVLQIVNDTQSSQLGYAGMNNNTMTLAQDTNVIIRLRVAVGKTIDNAEIKPMIATASGKDFEPYTGGQASPNQDYQQEIKVVTGNQDVVVSGINKLSSANAETKTNSDFSVTCDGEGIYTINSIPASSYRDVAFTLKENYTIQNGDYLQINNDFNDYRANIILKDTNNTAITSTITYNALNRIIDLSSYEGQTIKYVSIGFSNTAENKGTLKPLICNSSTQVPFEPYITPITKQLSLGDIELAQIGNYQDYIYKNDGKWYKKAYIGKVVFTGSETWAKSSSTAVDKFYYELMQGQPPYYSTGGALATHFTYLFNSNEIGKFYMAVYQTGMRLFVNFSAYGTTNVSQFKSWLNNNNVTCYYLLATPQDTEITDQTLISQLEAIQKLQQLNGKTIVSINGDLSAEFKLVYENDSINDLNTRVGNIEANYVKKTDYATGSVGGVVKVTSDFGIYIDNGIIKGSTKTYESYTSGSNNLIISKATLENVLNARIGDINTALDTINGEVIS